MLSEIEGFVNWVRRRSPGARTWKDYGYDLRFFVSVVGDRMPKDITFRDIDRFVACQVEKGFKPSTINRRLAAVISLYGFLAREDEELACPVIVRRHHVREQQRLPRPVEEEALKRFFSVIKDKRDRAMFLLMLRCGLRIGEVAGLQMTDLFLSEADCSAQITAHRLRHSFANDLLNADAPITSIQKLMGHRWIESTQTYVMANDKQVCADYYAACAKLEGWSSHKGTM